MDRKDQKIIHTADWHLGAPSTWGPVLNRPDTQRFWIDMFRTYRKNAIQCIVSEAIINNVMAVLVAGDVIDIYGTQGTERQSRMKDAKDFIHDKVIKPLSNNGIILFLTLGSHELRSKENSEAALTSRKEMALVLLDLLTASKGNVQLLVNEEINSLLNNIGLRKLGLRSSVLYENLTISCEQPRQDCDWIEFFHGEPRPVSSSRKSPMYRAFGHKHGLTCATGGCWYSGMPFPRSSASDATSEVGPRYCLLYKASDTKPEPIKLKVPEIAVMKKTLSQNSWQLLYQHDSKKDGQVLLEGPVDRVLNLIKEKLPQIYFVTLAVDTKEQRQHNRSLLQEAKRFAHDHNLVITANREGIVTIMLKAFAEDVV